MIHQAVKQLVVTEALHVHVIQAHRGDLDLTFDVLLISLDREHLRHKEWQAMNTSRPLANSAAAGWNASGPGLRHHHPHWPAVRLRLP